MPTLTVAETERRGWYHGSCMKHVHAVEAMNRISLRLLTILCLASGTGFATEVKLIPQGGVYTVPVRINNALTVNFVVDSGASEVQIPADVAQKLLHNGGLKESDFIQDRIYTMADGSRVKSERVLIRRIQIGDQFVEGVTASIGNPRSAPLIGQSLLYRFPTWSLDNRRHMLILGNDPARAAAPPSAPEPAKTFAPGKAPRSGKAPRGAADPPSSPVGKAEPIVEPIAEPARPSLPTPGSGGRDTRDKKLLRLLCGKTNAKKLLDCAETP